MPETMIDFNIYWHFGMLKLILDFKVYWHFRIPELFTVIPFFCLFCFPLGGVDPCEVWCSQPVEKLREYCNVIKIRMFWSLLFTRESTSFMGDFG